MQENKIICFKQDTKERKRFFKAASFSHPAKMILGLQIYLIEHYTKPGDTILDPMAGSGTILIACTLGRNVVLVELEDKFVKMQQDNWEKIKSLGPMLGFTMGEAVIIQGDSRNLDGLLADNILFSPPYAENFQGDRKDRRHLQPLITSKGTTRGRGFDSFGNKTLGKEDNPDNISNLPYGEVSAVISSPPFGEAHKKKGLGVGDNERADLRDYSYLKTGTKGQIGDMPYKADAVITSPPYEGSLETSTRNTKGGISARDPKLAQTGTYGDLDESVKRLRNHGRTNSKAGGAYGRSLAHPYSPSNENIGNLKSENYLEAMLRVYRQCHKVLKEKGLMVLVVKNFIRDKKIIRLDLDTIKLCEKAGFKLKEILQRKLTSQSFWRTIYHNKYPDVPKIEFEDVLIFERAT